jgi:1-acyl-sn-glycerol-3-phosphate acyltransferase
MLKDLAYRAASTAYWVFFGLVSVPFFLGALVVFAVTVPFDRRRVVLHLYSCFWASCCLHVNPLWRTRVEGRQHLPWRGPAVLVANHASLIDILVLFDLYRPFKWVAKDSTFRLPFLGWNMRLNDYVPIVRGQKESVLRMLAHCERHLANGMPVLIFPEGTRTPDGHLLPFKDGAFQLAKQFGYPLIPIAVHGTGSVLPKHGLVLREPMRARVTVLHPLDPSAFASLEALKEATRSAIATALAASSSDLPTAAGSAYSSGTGATHV